MERKTLLVGWLVTLLVVAALFARWMGWLDGRTLLSLGAGAIALVGLVAVLWVPWDLYFAARRVSIEQRESVARGIEVSDADRASAAALAPRLLGLALALHLLGALVVASVTWASGGALGYYFAAFYVLTMLLRPVGALYGHLRSRLDDLGERARHPRDDVLALRANVARLLEGGEQLEARVVPELRRADEEARQEMERRDEEARRREARYDTKVDSVLLELERSVGRLTEDRELLQGIRAFVRLARSG